MKDHELDKKIGFELRSQRLLKRMSLEEVAERMGVSSRNTISYLELGKKSIEMEKINEEKHAMNMPRIKKPQ